MLEADVKWDGCVNWQTNPDCMFHFCGVDDLEKLREAFLVMWQFTRDNLDVADADCFADSLGQDQSPEVESAAPG